MNCEKLSNSSRHPRSLSPRRQDPEGSASYRPPRHGQDAPRESDRRGSRCPVLQPVGERFRRNVRWRRRCPRPWTCFNRRNNELPALSSSMNSMHSVRREEAATSGDTMSGSRHSMLSSSKWMVSAQTVASSSWGRPTAPRRSIPHSFVPVVSIGMSLSTVRTSREEKRSSTSIFATSRSTPTSTSRHSPPSPADSSVPISPTW